jgi:type II secretory pathway pseudopilin PulG
MFCNRLIIKNIIHSPYFKEKVGFTIMETVMVLGVFAIAATYSLAIFVQSNTVQKRTANIQRTLSDARYVLEVMAREFRMGQLDYQYYGEPLPEMPVEELAILDQDSNIIRFRRQQILETGRYVVQLYYNGEWLDITPEDLNIIRLDFYISPEESPWVFQSGGYPNNLQPLLTIVMETESILLEGGAAQEPRLSHFQTTVASRKYLR